MRPNRIHQLIGAGRPAIGGWVSSPNPVAGELLGSLGFDTVTIDLQHGLIDLDAWLLLQASPGPHWLPLSRRQQPQWGALRATLFSAANGAVRQR